MRIILYIIKQIFTGENYKNNIIGFVFSVLFFMIALRLFNLQIINGQYYEDNYVQKSVKTVTIPAARGNIYDIDGNILAYNELVKNITIADVDAYKQNNHDINERNKMLLSLAKILEKYNCNIASRYFIEIDDDNKFSFTTTSEKQHRTFIANVYGRLVSDLDEGRNFQYRSDILPLYIKPSASNKPTFLSPNTVLYLIEPLS